MRANLTMKKLILTFLLFAFLAPALFAQNPVTNTIQAGPVKAKEVLVIFEVELKGLTPKPIQEGVLTDAITAELVCRGGVYPLPGGHEALPYAGIAVKLLLTDPGQTPPPRPNQSKSQNTNQDQPPGSI